MRIRKIAWVGLALLVVTGCAAPGARGVQIGPTTAEVTGVQTEAMPQALMEVPMATPVIEAIPVEPIFVPPDPVATAGVVTAGDIDDALNLAQFQRYQRGASRQLRWAPLSLRAPVLAQLRGPSGAPAPGLRVTLRTPGAETPFYDGYAGVDGMITVFPSALGQRRLNSVEMRVFAPGSATPAVSELSVGTARQIVDLPFEGGWDPDFLDLVFVLDTTGSMRDEMDWLAAEITAITRDLQRAAPGVDIRLGLVSYKAPRDPVVIRNYGFTRSADTFAGWVRREAPNGGRGGPEVVADALQTAVGMDLRRGKGERLIFQIGDEPPELRKVETFYAATRSAAANNIQVFGVGASGAEAQLEFLMRQASVATGGRYLFLTDDSGIGNAHAEPTIACYVVTTLSELMGRVLRSELSGQRIEAAQDEIVREVGSYRNGRCVQ